MLVAKGWSSADISTQSICAAEIHILLRMRTKSKTEKNIWDTNISVNSFFLKNQLTNTMRRIFFISVLLEIISFSKDMGD